MVYKRKKQWNYAFIDNENVNISVQRQGRKIDWEKLLLWLQDEFRVTKAYMFMWYLPKYQKMYDFFTGLWYELVFKPVYGGGRAPVKGNVDAELVLQAMVDIRKYNKAVILSGDGDFACLIRYLYSKNKLKRLVVPHSERYADLLDDATWKQKIFTLTTMQDRLAYVPDDEIQEDCWDEPFWA